MDRNVNRPAVMTEMSVSQMNDLEQQFTDNDRNAFDILAESFGWTIDQADEVWDWFSQRPPDQRDFETVAP